MVLLCFSEPSLIFLIFLVFPRSYPLVDIFVCGSSSRLVVVVVVVIVLVLVVVLLLLLPHTNMSTSG